MHPLLRIADVATLLATTPGAARRWLERKNVPVIDFGPGRGLGLRWSRSDVEEAILAMTRPAKKGKAKKPKLHSQGMIHGRTTAEILADLTPASPSQ